MDTKKVIHREKTLLMREEIRPTKEENYLTSEKGIIDGKNKDYILSIERKRNLAHILTGYKKKRETYIKDKEKRR